ncbi:MAG: glycosyltransferase [Ferruginibacter sp.]
MVINTIINLNPLKARNFSPNKNFKRLKVLILSPAPYNIAPSQRFRYEHYLKSGPQHDIEFRLSSFYDLTTWKKLYLPANYTGKVIGIIKGFLKRFFTLFTLFRYDFVYIHREVAPVGPPVFEWLIAKLFRKKIIYDFDDAIWVEYTSAANKGFGSLKCTWKVGYICKWSKTVSVGNQYLAKYAKRYCKDVRIIPTVVNTADAHIFVKDQSDKTLTIGWTGTFTNFIHLSLVEEPIRKLQEKYGCQFLIIADRDPLLQNVPYTFKKWNAATEAKDLLTMNIGIMPLHDMEIVYGKCAFKAIQYMSLGIPAVVTPIEANCEVVDDNKNGFWAGGSEEWYNNLEKLLLSQSLREQFGIDARNKIQISYSVAATESAFFELFTSKTNE